MRRMKKNRITKIDPAFDPFLRYALFRDSTFLRAFSFGGNDRIEKGYRYDPAIEPFASGCTLETRDEDVLVKVLENVYFTYGKKGLEQLRTFYLSFGIMEFPLLTEVEDPYHLLTDFEDQEGEVTKSLFVKRTSIDPMSRVAVMLNHPVIQGIKNENLKSALFLVDSLLYHQGSLKDETELRQLVFKMQALLPELKEEDTLHNASLWSAIQECCALYLEQELPMFVSKEGVSKIKVIKQDYSYLK